MSATGPERSNRRPGPAPPTQLPPAVQKLLAGPAPMKTMAAKGIAPLRPAELLTAVYQLSFDAEAGGARRRRSRRRRPARQGRWPRRWPSRCRRRCCTSSPAGCRPTAPEPLEKILYNPATADDTFVLLAGRLRERELEIIFQNEARLLRTPGHPGGAVRQPRRRACPRSTGPSSCARATACGSTASPRSTRWPSRSARIRGRHRRAGDDRSDVQQPAGRGRAAAPPPPRWTSRRPRPPQAAARGRPAAARDAEKSTRKSPIIDFTRLKLYEKIRLATLGNDYCRKNLMRDPNRMVAMAAIRSPRITDSRDREGRRQPQRLRGRDPLHRQPARSDQELPGEAEPGAEPQVPGGPVAEVPAPAATPTI